MTVKLSNVPEPDDEREPTVLERLNAASEYNAARLMRECRAAVLAESRVCRRNVPESERDALMQGVAVRVWADPVKREMMRADQRASRVATLRNVARWLIRDKREWLDTVDGWTPPPSRTPSSLRGTVKQHKPAPVVLTSLDGLQQMYGGDEQTSEHARQWARIEHAEREESAGESLPTICAAAHSADLAEEMIRRLADMWELTPRDQQRIRVAILLGTGESLATVGADQVLTPDQTKKAAAKGRAIIQTRAVDPALIARTRRESLSALGFIPAAEADPDPRERLQKLAVSAAARALESAAASERSRAGISGRDSLTCRPMLGTAADVLAYIGEAERVLDRRAAEGTHSRTRATRAPRNREDARGAIRVWHPTGPQRISTNRRPLPGGGIGSPLDSYARHHWPDGVVVESATYSATHPATRRDVWPRTAEYVYAGGDGDAPDWQPTPRPYSYSDRAEDGRPYPDLTAGHTFRSRIRTRRLARQGVSTMASMPYSKRIGTTGI